MTPQAPRGDQQAAKAKVAMAVRQLEEAFSAFTMSSKEGREILKVLSGLARTFGRDEDRAQSILPAELKSQLMSQSAPSGAPPPAGAAPPGLPPGGGGAAGAMPGG
jgi:hypothetical protein